MRAISISSCVLAILVSVSSALCAEDQSQDAIRKKLEAEYQLTKTMADKSDIVTAGSILVLHKDNLLMLAATSTNPCRNTYKDGKITQSGPCKANEKLKKFSMLKSHIPGAGSTPDSPSTRTFVAGEKFWLTKIDVRDSGKDPGIVLDFFTDAINDTRYATTLYIPFGAFTPSPDQALKMVAEVITVVPPEDAKDSKGDKQQSAAQGGEQAAAAPPRQTAPAPSPAAPAPAEAPPAPIEAPPPPAPDPVNVSEGQTIDQVVGALGQPLKKAKIGNKEIYSYKDLKITFVNGKVKDVQ
jgi:hypothetical protein